MTEVCADNRFEIIADYKRRLIEETNIETKPEEMAVLDSILFRFWQMGWLTEQKPVKPITQDAWPNPLKMCGSCGWYLAYTVGRPRYCPECGCEVKWDDA